MKSLEIIQMESISAGGIHMAISGACLSFGAAQVAMIVTTGGWGAVVSGACILHTFGYSNGWWQ